MISQLFPWERDACLPLSKEKGVAVSDAVSERPGMRALLHGLLWSGRLAR